MELPDFEIDPTATKATPVGRDLADWGNNFFVGCIFAIVVFSFGSCLSMNPIGWIIGFPLMFASMALPFVYPVVMARETAARFDGPCPYCGTIMSLSRKVSTKNCAVCEKLVSLRGSTSFGFQFYRETDQGKLTDLDSIGLVDDAEPRTCVLCGMINPPGNDKCISCKLLL